MKHVPNVKKTYVRVVKQLVMSATEPFARVVRIIHVNIVALRYVDRVIKTILVYWKESQTKDNDSYGFAL